MEPFVITGEQLFPPIKIIIYGVEYSIPKITTRMIEEADRYRKSAVEGDPLAAINQLRVFIPNLDLEVAKDIDTRTVRDALMYLVACAYDREKISDKEKKNPRPR